MINEEFDHVISLGSFCQTAYQIRRYFGFDTAYPFDWWVTPTISLLELVESEFVDLFKEKNMVIVNEDSGPAVMCSRYGIMHYHDFDKAKVSTTLNPFLVRASCSENVSKFAYLVNRLLNLSGKVLFIRHGNGYVQNYQRNCDFDRELIIRFLHSMRRLLPTVDFRLLLLNSDSVEAGPYVFFDSVENYGEVLWHGSDTGWNEMFERQQVRLAK